MKNYIDMFVSWLLRTTKKTPKNHEDVLCCELIQARIFAKNNEYIDLTDVLAWINGNLENLQKQCVVSACVVKGEELKDFIIRTEKYHVNQQLLDKLDNSVVIVCFDKCNNVIKDQMISSVNGLSEDSLEQFKGQPILRIEIPQ